MRGDKRISKEKLIIYIYIVYYVCVESYRSIKINIETRAAGVWSFCRKKPLNYSFFFHCIFFEQSLLLYILLIGCYLIINAKGTLT